VRILAHENSRQKAPVSIIEVIVAFAQAAPRNDDAQDQGDTQKNPDDDPV
jgi:hypothetical protein